MTDSLAPTAPPSPPLVLRALRRLEPADVVRAAAHLVTPAGVALDLHVRVEGSRVSWRGHTVEVPSDASWEQVARRMVVWASRAWRPGEAALDLEKDPAAWLKLVRSGARVYLAGSRELFDGQVVSFDIDVSACAARLVAGRVRDGELMFSGTLHVAGQCVNVRATPDAAHLEV